MGLGEKNYDIQNKWRCCSQLFLLHFYEGTEFEYRKIRMRTHMKGEGSYTIVANGYAKPEDDD